MMAATLTLQEYEDIRITVPWGHIAGRWYGNRQVRPILALHGWLDNLGTFNTLIPLLPAHVGILCIDLPGHGLSSHYPPGIRQHVDEFVPCIIRVMKEYQWNRVSLLGHSLGGIVCHMYASMYPHTVDMLISLDIVKAPFEEGRHLKLLKYSIEKFLKEDERARVEEEPPARTYEELERILNEGSLNSVHLENTKHLLERSIKRSQLYPDKYYFARDGRLKYYQHFFLNYELAAEMARRIKNVPYLIIKGSDSFFINEESDEVIEILRKQNPHFELHEIQGTHHAHLNNPTECAKFIVPFIHRHRPAILESWSLDEDETAENKKEAPNMRRKARERFFAWQKKRSKKIKPKSKL